MAVEQTVVTGTYSLYLLTSLPAFTAYTICGWFKWVSAPNSYQAPFGLVTNAINIRDFWIDVDSGGDGVIVSALIA